MSILTIIHPFLEGTHSQCVPIPLISYFHERRTQPSHIQFFRYIKETCPTLLDNLFKIIDCERGIRNAQRVLHEMSVTHGSKASAKKF